MRSICVDFRPALGISKRAPIVGFRRALVVAVLAVAIPALALAQGRYAVKTTGDVVQLRDTRSDVVVSVLTPVANAYEMVVKGHNVIRMTIKSVDEMRARPGLNGIPLLAPFANRLDQTAFYANGRKYNFDMELGNVRGPIPIHGYLSGANGWKVVEARADARGAWVTERLEFYRYPAYMKQFPFAHTLTMTYRVADGMLEVHTRIDNMSAEPMPVSIGFHPFFQLSDSKRSAWTLEVGAKTHLLLTDAKVPTGQTEPASAFFGGDPHAVPMSRFADRTIDDVFTDLDRDPQGRASVGVRGAHESLTIRYGPKYKAAVIFSPPPAPPRPAGAPPPAPPAAAAAPTPPVSAGPPIPLSASEAAPPPDQGFVAIEPMVGISNAMNAAHEGTYKDLQSIPPGGTWEESFWVEPKGY